MPMRLWSVVVSQPTRPRGWRSTRWATIWGTGVRVVVAISRTPDRRGAGLILERGARLRLRGVGARDRLLLVCDPRQELLRRQGGDLRLHARVAEPADERALAVVVAGLGDLEPAPVGVARDRLVLAAEIGDP